MSGNEFPVPKFLKNHFGSLLQGENFNSLFNTFDYIVNPSLQNSIWSKEKMAYSVSKSTKLGTLDRFFPLISKNKSTENTCNNSVSNNSVCELEKKKRNRKDKRNGMDVSEISDKDLSKSVVNKDELKKHSKKNSPLDTTEVSDVSSSEDYKSLANTCSQTFNELSVFHSTAIGDLNKSVFAENSKMDESNSDSSNNSKNNTKSAKKSSSSSVHDLQCYSQYRSFNDRSLSSSEESDKIEPKKTNGLGNGTSVDSNLTSTDKKIKDKKRNHSLSDDDVPTSQELKKSQGSDLISSLKVTSNDLSNEKSLKNVSFAMEPSISEKDTTVSSDIESATWLKEFQKTMKNVKEIPISEDDRVLRTDDISDENEYFVVQISKEVDIQSFISKTIIENNSITLQEAGQDVNYNCFIDRQVLDQDMTVVLPTEDSQVKIAKLPVAGRIFFTKCPDVSVFKCEAEVVPSMNTSFPNRLQERLSLLPTMPHDGIDPEMSTNTSIALMNKRKRERDIPTDVSDQENSFHSVPIKKIKLSKSQKVESSIAEDSRGEVTEEKKKKKHNHEEMPLSEPSQVEEFSNDVIKKKKKKKHSLEEMPLSESSVVEEFSSDITKKKKKKKHSLEDASIEVSTVVEDSCDGVTEKKIRKKKHNQTAISTEVLNHFGDSDELDNRKNKKKMHQEEMPLVESSNIGEPCDHLIERKKKKKKRHWEEDTSTEVSIVTKDSCDGVTKKKKKKHNQTEVNSTIRIIQDLSESAIEDMAPSESQMEDSEQKVKKKKKKKKSHANEDTKEQHFCEA